MTNQLTIYNLALEAIRETRLASLVEDRPARYSADMQYPVCFQQVLEAGFWKFAMRSVQIDYDTSITPAFGLNYAFTKPTDWVKTYYVCADGRFNVPFDNWQEENQNFWADISPIYVRYVSDDTAYGGSLANWTTRAIRALADELAFRIAPKVTGSSDNLIEELDTIRQRSLAQALSFEALREPARKVTQGDWTSARWRSNWGRDRLGNKLLG